VAVVAVVVVLVLEQLAVEGYQVMLELETFQVILLCPAINIIILAVVADFN
jgi:hypothetical protein